jgi:short-subunit dehydrogenase
LVTGASGGIGSATAAALAAAGARVVHVDVDDADFSRPGAARALARDDVDILVNCAGVGQYGAAEDADAALLFAVNVVAAIELTQAVLPGMRARGGGHVVNVGSLIGHLGRPREAVYAATKAALAVFTSSLREELRGTGVGVSLVSPAAVATEFFARRGEPYGRRFPRPVPPERVARAIVEAIERDRAEVFVPRWLALPVRIRGVAPGLYRTLARAFDTKP